MPSAKGPIAKCKRIAEKNAAKGQSSLINFYGPQNGHGVRSNKSAFLHYAASSNTYNNDYVQEAAKDTIGGKSACGDQ